MAWPFSCAALEWRGSPSRATLVRPVHEARHQPHDGSFGQPCCDRPHVQREASTRKVRDHATSLPPMTQVMKSGVGSAASCGIWDCNTSLAVAPLTDRFTVRIVSLRSPPRGVSQRCRRSCTPDLRHRRRPRPSRPARRRSASPCGAEPSALGGCGFALGFVALQHSRRNDTLWGYMGDLAHSAVCIGPRVGESEEWAVGSGAGYKSTGVAVNGPPASPVFHDPLWFNQHDLGLVDCHDNAPRPSERHTTARARVSRRRLSTRW